MRLVALNHKLSRMHMYKLLQMLNHTLSPMQRSGLMQVLIGRQSRHLHHDGITPDTGQCMDSSFFTMLDIATLLCSSLTFDLFCMICVKRLVSVKGQVSHAMWSLAHLSVCHNSHTGTLAHPSDLRLGKGCEMLLFLLGLEALC